MTVRAPASARAGERAIGEVADRIRAEQDEHVDASFGRGVEDAGGVETALGRDAGPALGEPLPARRRATRGRATGRARARGRARRGRWRGAARRGSGRPASRRAARPRPRRPRRADSANDGRPTMAVTVASDSSARAAVEIAVEDGVGVDRRRVDERSHREMRLAGAVQQRHAGDGRQPGRRSGSARSPCTLRLTHRVAEAEEQDRQLLLQVAAGDDDRAAFGTEIVDGRLRQAERRPRPGSPSPSCASTLSVPITPFASFAHAYAASFVRRAPPSTATDDGLGLRDRLRRRAERLAPMWRRSARRRRHRRRACGSAARSADRRTRWPRSRTAPCRTASPS